VRGALGKILTAAGPTAAQARGGAFQWFEVVDPEFRSWIAPEDIDRTRELPVDLVLAVPYGDRRYLALSTKPDEVMLWQDDWGLLSLCSFLTAKGELPETFVFRTREGGLDLLQILACTKDPEGVRIRHKLAP
jgi:hypothetical protein